MVVCKDAFGFFMKKKYILLCASSVIGDVLAQSSTLPPVVITASRISSSSLENLDQKDMHDYRYVNDVLQANSGLTIRSNGYRGMSSIFIRGGNSEHTSITIDGMDMNDITSPGGSCDSSILSVEGILHINVQRGLGSNADDMDNLAGSIALRSERGSGPLVSTLVMEGGSYDSYYQSLNFKGAARSFDYNFLGFHEGSNGIVTCPSDMRIHYRQSQTDPYVQYAVISRVGYEFNDMYRVNIFNRMHKNKKYFVDMYRSPTNPSFLYSSDLHMHKIELERYGEQIISSLSYWYSDVTHLTTNEHISDGYQKKDSGLTHALAFKNQWEMNPAYTMLLNFKWSANKCFMKEDTFDRNIYREKRFQLSWGHQLKPKDWFKTEGWLRFHNDTHEMSYITYKIKTDLTYKNSLLSVSFARGQKSPSLSQLYRPYYGNPSLKPERSVGYDISFTQILMPKKIFVGITYFFQNFTNLILADPMQKWQLHNIGRADTDGLESFVTLVLKDRWKIKLDHTYLYTKDASTKKPLLRRPLYKLGGSLTYSQNDNVEIGFRFHTHGKELDYNEREQRVIYVKGRWICSMWGNWRIEEKSNIRLYARLDNIMAIKYEKPCCYNAPGFSCVLGLKMSLDS